MSPSFWWRKLQCVNTTELNLILKSHAANQSMCVNSYLNNTEGISGNLPPHYPKKIWDRRLHLASWHTGSFEENLLEVYHSGNPRQNSQETAIKITKKPCFLHPTEYHQVHNIIYIYIFTVQNFSSAYHINFQGSIRSERLKTFSIFSPNCL